MSAQKVSEKYRFYDQKTPYDLTAIARMPATNYAIEGNIKISHYEKYSYRNVLNFLLYELFIAHCAQHHA